MSSPFFPIGNNFAMDNSGRGPLRVPGFGGIPLNLQHPGVARFAHSFVDWHQSPMVTAQEQAMVLVMNRLTDKPGWSDAVFDDETVAQWRAELDADRERTRQDSSGRTKSDILLANPRLFKGSTWAWCVQELRDKARFFQEHGHVRALDAGSCVCKSDSAALGTLGTAMQRAVEPLSDAVAQRTGYYREHPVRQAEEGGRGQDENMSAAELPLRPLTAASAGEAVKTPGEAAMPDAPDVPHMSVANAVYMSIIPSADTDYIEPTGSTPSYHIDADDDPEWLWEPPDGEKLLDIEGSAHMVRSLVDPLAFPLVYGRTPVLQQGGAVTLDDMLGRYGSAERAPYPDFVTCPKNKLLFSYSDGSASDTEKWCEKYQSLPCEVAFTADNGTTGTGNAVRITSYINGLHPDQRDIYTIIEQVLSRCIQPWNDCLVLGHHDAYDWDNHDQVGYVPARILTFGIQWINELPSWVSEFELTQWRNPNPDFALPPVESDLWQLARDYLKRPGCVDPDGWLADWAPGDSRTWDLLHKKANRLAKFKHPEPGTAFSYDEWKTGQHGDRAIVDMVPVEEPPAEFRDMDEQCRLRNAWLLENAPPCLPLQDCYRAEGLQVFVEISSIELSPAMPAYAPHAAARLAAYATRAANWLAKGLTKNEPVVEDEMLDLDGWSAAGRLNERVAAVAVFVFDADNITAPHIGFRHKIFVGCDQYWFRGLGGNNGYGSDEYNPLQDDHGTLGEVFAMPTLRTFTSVGMPEHPYQHMGSVALLSPQSAAGEGGQGRLVAFPNQVEHRIEPFRLVDATRPGRLRWLTLHLVDPHYRICSTRNVPPQQHSWWAVPVSEALAGKGLPAELISQILHDTGDWPMGVEEAQAHHTGFMKEADRVQQYCRNQ